MPLTREFRDTVLARIARDARYREALFAEALNAFLAGDTGAGKSMLRDLVHGTVGFEGLALATGMPSKSLHRMLAPRGNPSMRSLFEIVRALQKAARVRLGVTATSRLPQRPRSAA